MIALRNTNPSRQRGYAEDRSRCNDCEIISAVVRESKFEPLIKILRDSRSLRKFGRARTTCKYNIDALRFAIPNVEVDRLVTLCEIALLPSSWSFTASSYVGILTFSSRWIANTLWRPRNGSSS